MVLLRMRYAVFHRINRTWKGDKKLKVQGDLKECELMLWSNGKHDWISWGNDVERFSRNR